MSNLLLLIGIDKYLYQKHLNNCVKDVKDFRDILLEKYDFEESEIFELFNENATNSNIQDVLSRFSQKLSLDDNLVIFFSGHGHYDKTLDRGFWIPVEGTGHYPTWIANDAIIALLERIQCKHIFLISDTCFSNQLLVPHPTKSIGEYYNRKSRWALTSAFLESYDSEKDTNSVFASSIIEFLINATHDFRVGELIESVKVSFSTNHLQTPQGSPLYCKGHSGGEMVFFIRQALDTRNFRSYNDFLKALKLYKRNSQFRSVSTFEDRTKRIGYQLFHEVDSVIRKVTYYLYLYQGASQNQTYRHLSENCPQIFKDKNLLIFTTKERGQADVTTRLENIKKKFKPTNVFYIDDFIREQCTPKIEFDNGSTYLSISNFILPSFANGLQNNEVKDFIHTWFTKNEKPIVVIKGTGGIGKTTFAQYISDLWIKKSPDTCVMFIDSVQIKDLLIRRNLHTDDLGIYDFYDAFWEMNGPHSVKLSKEVFTLNVDAGNILVVIDGLDEVISKVPKFDIDLFLKSISESSKDIGGGKVVITCRTHFWDNSDTESIDLSVIQLEPFNLKQAKLFFEKSLDSNSKVKKALKLAEQFTYPGKETNNIFHPYVLDVIRSIMGSGREAIEVDLSEFSSKLLNSSVKNDYIIYRICDRERKRVGQVSVDDQIRLFMYLATKKRGTVKTTNFRDLIEEALNKKIDATNAIAFRAHPFLRSEEQSLEFRYDFLEDLFKSIYIASFFDFDATSSELPEEFLQIVEENCWYGSGINGDIVNRLEHWNEFDMLLVSDFIKYISNEANLSENKTAKTIGNLFALSLEINTRFNGNGINSNTALLKVLFEKEPNSIYHLALNNISVDFNVRFDFSNLKLVKCYINGFGSFWDCKFNDATRFIECHLLSLKARTEMQSLSKSNFIDCVFDNNLEDTLRKFEETAISRVEQTKVFLNQFFHLFFSGGKLGRQWEHKIIQPRFRGISQNRFNYNETVGTLRTSKVLVVTRELGQTKLAISDEYKEDIVRFTKDGTISPLILRLIKQFSN